MKIVNNNKKNQARPSLLRREIKFSSGKLNDRELTEFYQQFQSLIESGLDVNLSLSYLQKQIKRRKVSELIDKVQKSIVTGGSVSEAMRSSGGFHSYDIISMEIAEETGQMNEILLNLSSYYDQKIEQRREIVSGLSYPILVVLAAMGAVTFMLFFVVPIFEDVFNRFGGELPAMTRFIIDLSVSIRLYFPYFLILLSGMGAILFFLRNSSTMLKMKEWVVLSIPVVGKLHYKMLMSKFCNSMSLLLSSNIQLVKSLNLNQSMYSSHYLKFEIEQIIQQVMKGGTLKDSIDKSSFFDQRFKIFVTIGEESGNLAFYFGKLSIDYRSEIKYQTQQLNTVLEPILIVVLGFMVGSILIAMYLPMFELSSQMSM